MHQMQGHLDPYLSALSILIAFAASYTALDLASRIRTASAWAARYWLGAAAVALGGGIWSMHFIAMLALRLPVPVNYDLTLTALSLLIAIGMTAVGLHLAARGRGFAVPALVMGAGIAAMHYTGMLAMHLHGGMRFDVPLVGLSILISVGASYGALRFATGEQPLRWRIGGAALMGLAVSGMHHTGMAATAFMPSTAGTVETPVSVLAQTSLAMAVAAMTFLILMLGIAASLFDRGQADTASRDAKAAREVGDRFRALYRKTPLPLQSVDAHGRIEDVSDAWLDLMGYTRREDVVGRPLSEFMTPIDARIREDRDWPELLQKDSISDREMQFLRRDGKTVDVLLSAQVDRDERGTFLRSIEGVVDITERKLAEAGLRQAQKMEAVGQLTGGIAHDFNNLLMIMSSALGMIERGRPPERFLPGMRQAVERASKLSRQLLTFSRKESVNAEIVDVAARVGEIKGMLEQSLTPDVRLSIETGQGGWNAEVDPGEFDLAILNLVVNARDAMPQGGEISIRARNATTGGGEAIVVEVVDTGVGMDKATASRVFEPFFTTKPAGKGTGLGLSHVYGFARQSGGTVEIDSVPGSGTTIRITLPRCTKAIPVKLDSVPDSRPRRSRGLVLVVEDTPGVALATGSMLQEIGFSVVHAADAEEALGRLEENGEIEAVLSDIVMPGRLNGIGLAREIERRRPGLPVVLMTGYSRALEDEEGLDILRKPFLIDALESRLDAAIEASEVKSVA